MRIVSAKRAQPPKQPLQLGPDDNGRPLMLEEFDEADFVEGWRYELVHGVLIVSPRPLRNERDPNEELGHWLRSYRDNHPQGAALDWTVNEELVKTYVSRRAGDRTIWAGLGRLPGLDEPPTIIAEFVSKGMRNRVRDYEEKRIEYQALGAQEYWIFDRFERTLTVFFFRGAGVTKRVRHEHQTYTTKLLPGFALPLKRLFELANRWPE